MKASIECESRDRMSQTDDVVSYCKSSPSFPRRLPVVDLASSFLSPPPDSHPISFRISTFLFSLPEFELAQSTLSYIYYILLAPCSRRMGI